MFKKVSSVLGFASLLIIGAPATGYSDSLAAIAGHTWSLSDASCIGTSWSNIKNNCSRSVKVLIPVQSRATGTWYFYASKPNDAQNNNQTFCRVVITDQQNGSERQTERVLVSANNQAYLGSLPIYTNSVVHYDCDLNAQAELSAITWAQ